MERAKRIFLAVPKWGPISLALLGLLVGPPIVTQAEGKGKEIVLVHSNNLNGYLFPCPT